MKTIFIDRDGVINKDPAGWTAHSYVTERDDFHFLPGSLEALKMLNDHGIGVIIISNQAGVNKGYFTKERLAQINEKMLGEIKNRGGNVKAVYYCPHREEENCSCRKPKTGLFELASRKHRINMNDTYMIGDGQVDIEAGRRIGMKTIFVLSGKTSSDQMMAWPERPDYVFKDLLGAVKWLLEKKRRKDRRARRAKGRPEDGGV